MLLIESIELINGQLERHFGSDITGRPYFRIVWSEDQFEKRLTEFTDAGVALLTPEVRELPKYRQWIHAKYILEGLTIVPEPSLGELPVSKFSYEPVWVFEDRDHNYLPPKFDACKFILDNMQHGKAYFAKYRDPDADPLEAKHNAEKRISAIEEELFGNETEASDALRYREGVSLAQTKEKENVDNVT